MDFWNLLKNERNNWQRATKNDVTNRLLSRAGTSDMKDEKLVVVFGKPQVGKTTLILSLMGIDESKREEIGLILRAGRSKGESSTSTAIIYQMSSDAMFGIAEHSIDDFEPVEIEKCDEKRFKCQLRKIREEVEKRERHDDKVLYVYIPTSYFSDDVHQEYSNINILDVPGANSRDEKERIYANRILDRYGSAASVNIIVKEANDINDLRVKAAPNGVDRIEKLTHKYFVVLTRAYSQDSVRNDFFGMESPEDYRRCMQEVYDAEFKRIFGEEIPRYFPIEVGESFDKLLERQSVEKRHFLKQYRDSVLEEIRQNIQELRGNGLKAWRENMMKETDYYIEEHQRFIQEIIEKQKQALKRCERKRKESEQRLEETNAENEIKKIKNKINKLRKIKEKLESIEECVKNIDGIFEEMEEFLESKYSDALVWEKKDKIASEIKIQYAYIIENSFDNLNNIFSETEISYVGDLIKQVKEEAKDKGGMLSKELKRKVADKTPGSLVHLGVFLNLPKEASKILCEYLKQCNEEWNKKTWEYIDEFQKQIVDLKNKKSNLNSFLEQEKNNLNEYEEKIDECKKDISEKENEKEKLDKQKIHDDDVFKNFNKTMEDNFQKQKREIIRKINFSLTAAEKVRYVLLLGIIEQDYIKMRNNM